MSYATLQRRQDDVSLAEGDVPVARAPSRPTLQNLSAVADEARKHTSSLIFSPPLVQAAIVRPRRVFRMRGTFVIESKHLDEGSYFVRHRELPVYGYGETLVEALNGFCEMFEYQWSGLVEANEADLSEDALAAREQFRKAVEAVIQR